MITGAGGFLGDALSRRLTQAGVRVVGVDLCAPKGSTADWMRNSVQELPAISGCLSGINCVVHFAWSNHPGSAETTGLSDLSTNVHDTLRFFRAAADAGVRHFIFASSGGTVYGRATVHPTPEYAPLMPISIYGAAKAATELYLHALAAATTTEITILRLANPYGPGQIPWRGQGAIATAAASAILRRQFPVWGDGSTVRDYLFIDDAIDAIEAVMAKGSGCGALNVGSGVGLSLNSVIKVIETAVGQALPVVYSHARHVDIPISVLDIGRLTAEYNWRPATPFAEGIRRTVEWLNGNDSPLRD